MFTPELTILETYARHGSTSYGHITPVRLEHILLGDNPDGREYSQVRQALMEMPGKCAFKLAAELGLSHEALNKRSLDILGEELPR